LALFKGLLEEVAGLLGQAKELSRLIGDLLPGTADILGKVAAFSQLVADT